MIRSTQIEPQLLVQSYIDDVLKGVRATCAAERNGVERYLSDRKTAITRGWRFDEKLAIEAVDFFPRYCRHSLGQWAGDPFVLTPWQAFCVWNVMGWRDADDKYRRRFRKAYITVARKNGKTTWAAAFALLLLFFDYTNPKHPHVEVGGRGFCAATKQPQATLLWSEAKRMIEQSPALAALAEIRDYKNLIALPDAPWCGSEFQPVGADGSRQDGLNPSFVVKDEIHAWSRCKAHRDLNEKLSTGGASRHSPLEIIITTAGDDESEIWEEEHEFATRCAAGGIDDTYFAFIAEAEPGDDEMEEATWQKANPNWGISVNPTYIVNAATEAINKSSSINQFIRYHCNRRVASFNPAYPDEVWKLGAGEFADPPKKAICYGGMDLGRSDDFCGVTFVFPELVKGLWHYKLISRTWAARGQGNSRIKWDRDPWRTWIAEDKLTFQDNEILDYTDLKAWIREIRRKYTLKSLAYDSTFANEVAAELLNDYGVPMFEFFQTFNKYTEPIKSFEKALKEGRIQHRNDPVLRWQAGNAEVKDNPRADGTCMIAKGGNRRWKKVDAVVAMLMGYGEAIYAAGKRGKGAAFITPAANG